MQGGGRPWTHQARYKCFTEAASPWIMRTLSAEVEEGAGRWTPVDPSGRIQMLHRGSLTMDHEDIVCRGGGGCGEVDARGPIRQDTNASQRQPHHGS